MHPLKASDMNQDSTSWSVLPSFDCSLQSSAKIPWSTKHQVSLLGNGSVFFACQEKAGMVSHSLAFHCHPNGIMLHREPLMQPAVREDSLPTLPQGP